MCGGPHACWWCVAACARREGGGCQGTLGTRDAGRSTGIHAQTLAIYPCSILCAPFNTQAWKSVQLAVLTLWNACARSGNMERHVVEKGVCDRLLAIINFPSWPPSLRDTAGGCLEFFMERCVLFHGGFWLVGWNKRVGARVGRPRCATRRACGCLEYFMERCVC